VIASRAKVSTMDKCYVAAGLGGRWGPAGSPEGSRRCGLG
jgi:hypothetical protein